MILLLISFSAFPVSIIYLSPGPPLMSLKAGVINLSVLVLFSIIISGFFTRRAFCGWICPGGGCQLVATTVNDKRIEKKQRDWIRIILILAWVLLMLSTIIYNAGAPVVDLDHPGAGKFAYSKIRFFLPYIPTVVFMFLFVLIFGRRGFCHRGCWIYLLIASTTKLGSLLRLPSLHMKITAPEACNGCKLCTSKCSMSIDVRKHIMEERPLPNYCIQCGVCADQCKNEVLKLTFSIP